MIHENISIENSGVIITYMHNNSSELWPGKKRPVVIICPGGSYAMTSDREGEGLALKFMGMDCHGVVLQYTVEYGSYPTALNQLAFCVKYLRENADRYNIDKNKIIIQGSSAGGHLAACYCVFWKEMYKEEVYRPNGMILSYPVVTSGKYTHEESMKNLLGENYEKYYEKLSPEKYVNKDVPKTFIWHNFTDETVPVENSLLFAMALKEKDINTELHIFNTGGHGLGTCGKLTESRDGGGISPHNEIWLKLAEEWLKRF